MNESPLILAIDNGTQSVRALLFDLQGNLVEKVRIPSTGIYFHRAGHVGAGPADILGCGLPGLPAIVAKIRRG